MVNSETPDTTKTVETRITAVTVYTDQALVIRQGVVDLTGVEKELVIPRLPVIETESVRVSGAGNVGVRLLGVSTETIYTTEPVAENLGQITRQIEQLEIEKRQLQAQVDALTLQSSFIQGLREKAEEPFAVSLARKNMGLSETLDLLNFLGSQYAEYAISADDYKTQQQELDKQIQTLRQQLKQIDSPKPLKSINLRVKIEPDDAGEFELEVSYVVSRASWTPLYDIRVDSDRSNVSLSYLSAVTQNTGEDWSNAALTLSTAKPGLGTIPPRPEPWFIDTLGPVRTRNRVYSTNELALGAATPRFLENDTYNSEAELSAQEMIAAQTLTAEISRDGGVVTFQISGGGNIPSDGSPHKNTIFNAEFPCNFEYVAMPRLVSFAYLQANVKNSPDGATLLPGLANIFRDNIFVGTTKLENTTPGEEFTLNLGIDESVGIQRELVEREVDKKFIGNNRKITYGYRLIITNLLNKETSLRLTEQLPVSRNEQIKVRLIRTSPQISLGEMGMLQWSLNLSPQAKQEVYYQFTVEHPPQLTVVGLDN